MKTIVPQIRDGLAFPPQILLPPADSKSTSISFVWGIRFLLPQTQHKGGYVVQRVLVSGGRTGLGAPVTDAAEEYWEAWPVKAGSAVPMGATTISQSLGVRIPSELGKLFPLTAQPLHDWWGETFTAVRHGWGGRKMAACALFFELGGLPASFTLGGVKRAGDLPATTEKPDFWQDFGNTRYLEFSWSPSGGQLQPALRILRRPDEAFTGASPQGATWENHSKTVLRVLQST